jgi:hypothetical protein
MRRELKRDRPPAFLEEAVRRAKLVDVASASSGETRWFEALDPEAPPPPRKRTYAAPILVALALIALAVVKSALLRVLLPLALALAAIALLLRARRGERPKARALRRGPSSTPNGSRSAARDARRCCCSRGRRSA